MSPTSGIVNPMVSAGLFSPDLMDILAVRLPDAAVAKQQTKRITGARCLTAQQMSMRGGSGTKERGKKKEEKETIKRKEERERKRKEKEEMLKQKAASRERGRGRGRGRGNGRGRGGRMNQRSAQESANSSGLQETQDPETNTDLSGPQGEMAANENDVVSTNRGSSPVSDSGNSESESNDGSEANDDSEANELSRLPQPAVSRFGRHHQVPSRYQTGSSDDSDNDGTLCCICNRNEPDGLTAALVFWVDCSECGSWVHNHCAFGNNTASHKYS